MEKHYGKGFNFLMVVLAEKHRIITCDKEIL